MRLWRPYWPQTASKFEVRFHIRADKICFCGCQICKTRNISSKLGKFPFHCRITRLCGVNFIKITVASKNYHSGIRTAVYVVKYLCTNAIF